MVSVAIDPPPSARRERPPRTGLIVAFSLAVLAALGVGFWVGRITAPRDVRTAATGPAPGAAPAPAATSPTTSSAAPSATPSPNATATSASTPTATPDATATAPNAPAAAPAAVRRLSVTLDGPLEGSIASALPKDDRGFAEELTAVVNRLLVWEMHVARDGRRGDRLDVLWSAPASASADAPAGREPVVHALRYASSKLGTVVAAYRYERKGARWARYYRADGSEVETRLADPPVADYEQITSLLRDGRRHKGVDFKTPIGSPVAAPFEGVIERRNWHFAANGNCLDIRDPASGRHAIFLHLDILPKEMQPGRKVRKGEVVASSGNSGHSFAPHLHYQLEDAGGRVLDPFEVLRTERWRLPPEEKTAFEAARAKLDAALGG